VQALIAQNGNAYAEGLTEFLNPIRKYWEYPSLENRNALRIMVDRKSTEWQYQSGVSDQMLLDPTAWIVDQAGLDRPGNDEIQLDLFYDYRKNIELYLEFFFRKYQPPMLVVWGKNDLIFPAEGAAPYSRDLTTVETHLLGTGHFALETHGEEVASRIEEFFRRHPIHSR